METLVEAVLETKECLVDQKDLIVFNDDVNFLIYKEQIH